MVPHHLDPANESCRRQLHLHQLAQLLTGESDIPSDLIGELVMEGLAGLDQVAYVRFASVYKNFHEARDFEKFIGDLEGQADD